MKQFRKNIENLEPSKSMSAGIAQYDEDVLNLTMGVPILNKKIIIPEIETHNYLKSNGTKEGLKKISELFYDNRVNPDNLIITSGAKHGIFTLLSVLNINKIANMTPSWLGYKALFKLLDIDFIMFDKTSIENIVAICKKEKVQALLIDNPSNPTSTVLTVEIIKRLSSELKKNGCLLIIDEVYKKLTFSNEYKTDLLIDENIIRVGSLSKAYGAPGLRIGYIQSENTELINKLEIFIQHSSSCIPEICIKILLAITKKQFNHYILESNNVYNKRFNEIYDLLNNLGYDVEKAESGFYLFFKTKDNIDLEKRFLGKYKILGISGVHYGAEKNYLRLSLGISEIDYVKLIEKLSKNV